MNKSRLIHTAPVFEPNSGRASSAGGVKGSRGGHNGGVGRRSKAGCWARGTEQQDLERLEEAFRSVGEQVRAQKEAAQKWIRRQRIRMEVCTYVGTHTPTWNHLTDEYPGGGGCFFLVVAMVARGGQRTRSVFILLFIFLCFPSIFGLFAI